jgi:hypothetical protein
MRFDSLEQEYRLVEAVQPKVSRLNARSFSFESKWELVGISPILEELLVFEMLKALNLRTGEINSQITNFLILHQLSYMLRQFDLDECN